MSAEDIAVHLPEHLKSFAELLAQFPNHYEKWVYADTMPREPHQGDVYDDLPFVFVDDSAEISRFDSTGMIISNTCDAQIGQGDTVQIAPIFDLQTLKAEAELAGEDPEKLGNHIRAIILNQVSHVMFIPETTGLRGSFVDFGSICSISSTVFHMNPGRKKRVSLSQYGHYFLLFKLAHHFCRPGNPR